MTDPAIIAERLAASYPTVPVDAVVSSGHSFLIRGTNQEPPARAMREKRIVRTLRSLADHALVPVEPRVWKTQDRDLLIRLDGFGPTVDMDADAARLALIDVLGSPEPDEGQHPVIVDALHAIASTMTATTMRIGCSAPTPWRPACFECDPSLIPAFGWWTGSNGLAQRPTRPTVEHTVLDPDTAAPLPRVVCIGDGPVTLDDRFGMLLRPVSWTGRTHQTMDAMGVIRAHAALADMLASHDPAPTDDADDARPRHETPRPVPAE